MFGHSFYHGLLRKYIIMFGNMFNEIDINRYDSNGNIIKSIRLPISYAPKEKFYVRIQEDPNLNRQFSQILPRISFEMIDVQYDAERSLNKTMMNRYINAGTNDFKTHFSPVPYNINIDLNAMFSHQEDAVQFVEQVVPFFRPEWTHSVKLISDIDEYYDIPTILNNITISDNYDSDFQTRRVLTYTLSFTIKGYLIGPVKDRGVITKSILDFSSDSEIGTPWNLRTELTPAYGDDRDKTDVGDVTRTRPNFEQANNTVFGLDREEFFDGIDRHGHDE
jgi:hypothetical protein